MKTKELLLTPKLDPFSLETLELGAAVSKRFREMLVSGEASFNAKGIKVIKRELALTIRRETGNMLCLDEAAKAIDDAVAEYVDSFIRNVRFNDPENAFYLANRLACRIEKEVLHANRDNR